MYCSRSMMLMARFSFQVQLFASRLSTRARAAQGPEGVYYVRPRGCVCVCVCACACACACVCVYKWAVPLIIGGQEFMRRSMFEPSDTYPHNVPFVKSPVLRNIPQSKHVFVYGLAGRDSCTYIYIYPYNIDVFAFALNED